MRLRPLIPAIAFLALSACGDKDTSSDDTSSSVSQDTSTGQVDLDGDGYSAADGDCNDSSAEIGPEGTEVCDGIDNDCDGLTDESDATDAATWYPDRDADGFGDETGPYSSCDRPDGYVADGGDCLDSNGLVHPGADELCDDLDNDCDGATDEDDATDALTWYHDGDSDNYGDPNDPAPGCDAPDGYVETDTDCDDTDSDVHPGAGEDPYDGVDNDCDDGTPDDDLDGDGYTSTETGGVDCEDEDADSYPGAIEVCDDLDNDCNGVVDDDAIDAEPWYPDNDGDGFGDSAGSVDLCSEISGFVKNSADCDDTNSEAYPNAAPNDSTTDCMSDVDGDDYGDVSVNAPIVAGTDCDDADADTYPGAHETVSTKDNDCDGEIENMPIADASYIAVTSTLYHCDPLYLDGSDSEDPEGDDLIFAWELDAAPVGSTRTTDDIETPTDEQPTFWPDITGDYDFSLVVTDEGGAYSEADTLSVTVTGRTTNSDPVISAGDDQSYDESISCESTAYGYECDDCSDQTFTLDASGTTDADDDPLTYTWTILSGESYATIDDTSAETATLTVSGIEATYGSTDTVTVEVQLDVTDCYGVTVTDTVTITYTCTGS